MFRVIIEQNRAYGGGWAMMDALGPYQSRAEASLAGENEIRGSAHEMRFRIEDIY